MDTENYAQNPLFKPKDMKAYAQKAWGKEWDKKETAYEFSNGRKFDDSEVAFYQPTA